jgi:hypothetical protein
MDEVERRRVLAEAFENIDRIDRRAEQRRTEQLEQREPHIEGPNRLDRWREGVRAQEREFAEARAKREREEADEASNSDAWATWVSDQIAAASLHCARELATALKDELDVRDQTIGKLHTQVCRLEAEVAKLVVRVIKAEAGDAPAREIDLPNALATRRLRDVN